MYYLKLSKRRFLIRYSVIHLPTQSICTHSQQNIYYYILLFVICIWQPSVQSVCCAPRTGAVACAHIRATAATRNGNFGTPHGILLNIQCAAGWRAWCNMRAQLAGACAREYIFEKTVVKWLSHYHYWISATRAKRPTRRRATATATVAVAVAALSQPTTTTTVSVP